MQYFYQQQLYNFILSITKQRSLKKKTRVPYHNDRTLYIVLTLIND